MSAPNPAKAIGILMVLIGLGFGIYNYLKPSERDTLKKQGVSAVAMIVDKETTTTTYQTGSQRSESEKNVLKYTFPTETGQLIEAEKSVTFETLRLIEVGSSNFAVLYLPSDPSRHMSRADLRTPVPRQLLVAGGIIALYVIGLLLLAWYLGRRSRPLSFGGRLTLSLGVVAMLAGTTGGFLIYRDAAVLNEFDAGGTRVDAAVKGWGRRLVDNVWIHCFDYYLSRTRFPWTQNWLNQSVQGGPEHDR